MSADADRQDKQPPVRTHLRGGRRRCVTHVIFVVVADSPDVGAFHEFEIEHMAGGGTLYGGDPRGTGRWSGSRGFTKNFFFVRNGNSDRRNRLSEFPSQLS